MQRRLPLQRSWSEGALPHTATGSTPAAEYAKQIVSGVYELEQKSFPKHTTQEDCASIPSEEGACSGALTEEASADIAGETFRVTDPPPKATFSESTLRSDEATAPRSQGDDGTPTRLVDVGANGSSNATLPVSPVSTPGASLQAQAAYSSVISYTRTLRTESACSLPSEKLSAPVEVVETPEDSPYAEVRANVSNDDDPTTLVLTLRMWLLGLGACAVVSAFNTYCNLRYPSPLVTPLVTLVAVYPLGRLFAHLLPQTVLPLPHWIARMGLPTAITLNPGPFSVKEHTAILMMANVSTGPAFANNYILAASAFYGERHSLAFEILLLVSTQFIGFGAAGLCRRVLVWPASMIWPQDLPYCALLGVLHAGPHGARAGRRRLRFFLVVTVAAFFWYWLPGYLFTALSAFSWVCWLAPENVVVNQLFGVASGLGMGILTFDWSQIAYLSTPLVVPWWAQVNIFLGFAAIFWIVMPALYYSNAFSSAYLPLLSSTIFDRFGNTYETSRVLDTHQIALNVTAYADYSAPFMPIAYISAYSADFMLMTCMLVYTSLFHGREIWRRWRSKTVQSDIDVHITLMKAYPDVPDVAYLAFLGLAFALAALVVSYWPTGLPVWALLLAILIGLVYIVSAGYIYAVTSINVSVNMLVELVAGYLLPGRPSANMLFKVYGANVLNVGLLFAQDLKLSMYMKIPPRATFAVQTIAVVVTSCVQVAVRRWFTSAVPTLCEEDQAANLSCPLARTMYGASIIWGLIGPERLFGRGAPYHPLVYLSIAGALLPALLWAVLRRWPRSPLRHFNPSVALTGLQFVPPATGINFSGPFLVGYGTQYWLRRRHPDWWANYNYILSSALDAGTIVCALVIFLALQLPRGGSLTLDWWGNNVYMKTADWLGTPYKTPPPEGFGATSW